jgi:GT2 family glycosyltransferase/2-polyprenyl-3-methyl-5-hydroxy-6-metoxy-1,4-benzoquinol methylase
VAVAFRPVTYFRHQREGLLAYVPSEARAVLEVGCGAGGLGGRLRARQGCEVWGIECDPDAARAARARLDRVIETPLPAAASELPAAHFDVLIAADVLEHLADPWSVLQALRPALAAHATVLISLPNVQHHSVLRDLLHGRFTYVPAGILDQTHLRFFTRLSALELAQRAGLEVERVVPLYYGRGDRRGARWKRPPAGLPPVDDVAAGDFYASQFLLVARAPAAVPDTRRVRVSIVMLTFNRLDVTRQAIESLRRSRRQPDELIIVDNGSRDDTPAYLGGLEREGVRVIRNAENRGVAAGWNQGLRAATGDCLMVLNNDVLVSEDWLDRMVRTAWSVPRAGLVGCRTNYVGGPQRLTPDYDDLDDFPLFARRYAALADASWFELPRVVAVALLWRREVYDRVGGFDERFHPANCEDDDYCVRALAAGYRNLVANDVYIHHIGSVTQSANALGPDALVGANRQRLHAKWGAAAAPVVAAEWPTFEEHIALLQPHQYALPGWMLPQVRARALARQVNKFGRRLGRFGWHAAARAAFARSLRIAVTARGITGLLWNLRPTRGARAGVAADANRRS